MSNSKWMPGGQDALDDRLATSAGEPSVVNASRVNFAIHRAVENALADKYT
jgi:hypothetical protein